MVKRIFLDPSFLLLLGINLYCIEYYRSNPSEFNTIVFLYWGQSVIIGLFNFVDILTIRKASVAGNAGMGSQSTGCSASFFLVHYMGFHFAYFIFIVIQSRLAVDFLFILIGLAIFVCNSIIQFIQHKIAQKDHAVDISKMFFLPYLRIIPMHLMILGPAFLGWAPSTIFLVLKTIADLVMYLITSPHLEGKRKRSLLSALKNTPRAGDE